MSSFMDHIIAPYLTSPLANSTKIYNNVYSNGPDISLSNYYRNTATRRSILQAAKSITFCDEIDEVATEAANKNEADTTSENSSRNSTTNSTSSDISRGNKTKSPKKSARMAIGGKKPYVARKLITVKKPMEPIKAVAKNCKNQGLTVEKILQQINMTKYQQHFKKIDVTKFTHMKEIDLNAIGITRASEIKTFMDTIKKVQSNDFVLKK